MIRQGETCEVVSTIPLVNPSALGKAIRLFDINSCSNLDASEIEMDPEHAVVCISSAEQKQTNVSLKLTSLGSFTMQP